MRDLHQVVIVGGGFSGVAVAAQLLRQQAGLDVTLLESGDRVGRGVAYGTPFPTHLLNTRAAQMSLHEDDPEHFVRWNRRRGYAAHGHDFLPRRTYGEYLEESLAELRAEAPAALTVRLQAEAVDVVPIRSRFDVQLRDGGELRADAVVIATGHPPPADPLNGRGPRGSRRYLRDPWRHEGHAAVAEHDRVLVIGTGLTAVDVVLALEQRGHRGPIHALSRHGLLPRAHPAKRELLPADLEAELFAGLRYNDLARVLTTVRRVAARADERGIGWQAVLDALRPVVPRLWVGLCPAQRRRFVRKLQPFWDVHRHRLPPAQAGRVATLRADGRLKIMAGRLQACVDERDSIVAEYRLRTNGHLVRERYDWIINCTGSSYAKETSRPLEQALCERGLLLADPLGLGYVTTEVGAVIGARGVVDGLYVLGPACRASSWEHTAVPELRAQAVALAERLRLGRRAVAWSGARHHSARAAATGTMRVSVPPAAS